MITVNKNTLEMLKKKYPVWSRVRLEEMDDPYVTIPKGTLGTVYGVDDTGSILVHWDNGSSLNLLYGVDRAEKVK